MYFTLLTILYFGSHTQILKLSVPPDLPQSWKIINFSPIKFSKRKEKSFCFINYQFAVTKIPAFIIKCAVMGAVHLAHPVRFVVIILQWCSSFVCVLFYYRSVKVGCYSGGRVHIFHQIWPNYRVYLQLFCFFGVVSQNFLLKIFSCAVDLGGVYTE